MNTAEAVLYPSSYYSDVAVFVTKSIGRIFTARSPVNEETPSKSKSSSWSQLRRRFTKVFTAQRTHTVDIIPDEPSVPRAAREPDELYIVSDWDQRFYGVIVRIIQSTNLDESVAIGAVVLLEKLRALQDACEVVAAKSDDAECPSLPPYPHTDYCDLFMGAYMLSYRRLNQKLQPLSPCQWAAALGGIFTPDQMLDKEEAFMEALHTRISMYVMSTHVDPSLSSPACDVYFDTITPATGDALFNPPTFAFISPTQFTATKRRMYKFIYGRMASRGEVQSIPHTTSSPPPPSRRRRTSKSSTSTEESDISIHLPPCATEMRRRSSLLNEAKWLNQELWVLPFREVFAALMGGHNRSQSEYEDMLMKEGGLIESRLRQAGVIP